MYYAERVLFFQKLFPHNQFITHRHDEHFEDPGGHESEDEGLGEGCPDRGREGEWDESHDGCEGGEEDWFEPSDTGVPDAILEFDSGISVEINFVDEVDRVVGYHPEERNKSDECRKREGLAREGHTDKYSDECEGNRYNGDKGFLVGIELEHHDEKNSDESEEHGYHEGLDRFCIFLIGSSDDESISLREFVTSFCNFCIKVGKKLGRIGRFIGSCHDGDDSFLVDSRDGRNGFI